MTLILKNLKPKALKRIANNLDLPVSGTKSDLRMRIANFCRDSQDAFLTKLRKVDFQTIIRSYSYLHYSYLPGVDNFSKVELRQVVKSILLNVDAPEKLGFLNNEPARDYQIDAVNNGYDALVSQDKPAGIYVATGGGKTRIGNDIVAKWNKERGGTLLWIAKDWELLSQAMNDLSRRYPTVRVRRFGGDNKLPIQKFDSGKKFKGVVYTTLQTLHRSKNKPTKILSKASAIVWDENHWAQTSMMGQDILESCEEYDIPVLGLTATPLDNDNFDVVYQRSFVDLVNDGSLAAPIIVEPVLTDTAWSPEIGRNGEITQGSLQVLGSKGKRNRIIAEHYSTNSGKYGQTLVFACDIKHANRLVKALKRVGVSVAPIHGDIKEKQRRQYLQEFRDGVIHVLVNVEMLTHGINLPSVKTIFLCRPTASEILFVQMIGRGSRLMEGKSSFYIVDFTDNLKTHNDSIVTPKTYFKGTGWSGPYDWKTGTRSKRRNKHEYRPDGLAVWIGDDTSVPVGVRGLWLMRGQTFGIEFELTHPNMPYVMPTDPRWAEVAKELLNAIRSATPFVADKPIYGYAGAESGIGKDCSLWNVEYDSSVGFEVTSRILSDEGGYFEVVQVCEALDLAATKTGLKVNYKTGTHVHLGWNNRPLEDLRRVVRLFRIAEPALATLVAPSRLVAFNGHNYDLNVPNEYCEPISASVSEANIESWKTLEDVEKSFSNRYVTFNLKPLFVLGTVEVRMHSGTIEASKILLWTSFVQQILWAASVDRNVPATEDRTVIDPDGDIVEFARRWLPNANEASQAAFIRCLDSRREEILAIWRQHSELDDWVEFSDEWQCAN